MMLKEKQGGMNLETVGKATIRSELKLHLGIIVQHDERRMSKDIIPSPQYVLAATIQHV